MQEEEFRKYLRKRDYSVNEVDKAVSSVMEFEKYLNVAGASLESASLKDLKKYIELLISGGLNTEDRLLALARYFYLMKRNDFYTYFASILGGSGVYRSIASRLEELEWSEKRRQVFKGFVEPHIGSPPEAFPPCTRELLRRLNSSLPQERVREVLAGNHHRIPVEHFKDMRARWEAAATMEEFLAGEHKLLIAELEEAMKSGRLWYEQEITPEVVEYVRGDQTIQIGVLDGDVVLKSKIPFAPAQWLMEKDQKMRRYYGCHCQLAREAILKDEVEPLASFCYCSAGYEKLPLEVVLGVPLEVKVLESVLAGDERCRFAIKIPRDKLK